MLRGCDGRLLGFPLPRMGFRRTGYARHSDSSDLGTAAVRWVGIWAYSSQRGQVHGSAGEMQAAIRARRCNAGARALEGPSLLLWRCGKEAGIWSQGLWPCPLRTPWHTPHPFPLASC